MPHMGEVLAVDDAAQLPPCVSRRREAPTGELLLQPREDRLVRQAPALKLQVTAANERLRLLGQERQHLVDQPFGLAALQAGGPRHVLQEVFQIVRLGVAQVTLLKSSSEWNDFARNRAELPRLSKGLSTVYTVPP